MKVILETSCFHQVQSLDNAAPTGVLELKKRHEQSLLASTFPYLTLGSPQYARGIRYISLAV
jgi:hypothetical protein